MGVAAHDLARRYRACRRRQRADAAVAHPSGTAGLSLPVRWLLVTAMEFAVCMWGLGMQPGSFCLESSKSRELVHMQIRLFA